MLKRFVFVLPFLVLCTGFGGINAQEDSGKFKESQEPPRTIGLTAPAVESDGNDAAKETNQSVLNVKPLDGGKKENTTVSPNDTDKKNRTVPIVRVNDNATKTDSNEKHEVTTLPTIHGSKGNDSMFHPGAILRGFYVFVGLSVLVLLYIAFRAYRLRSGCAPPSTVRKYGVVARRGDVEMLPLPLGEEEDDDTLFDVGNHPQSNRQYTK